MSAATADHQFPTAEPLVPSPQPLPPSQRDFEIHRKNQIEHRSTRQLAEKYKISQTRVRQIVRHTSLWIAHRIPPKTDLQIDQEQRLAQALAADEYQHQLEYLQTIWDATHEIKYHRQLIRVIAAKARLGAVPGAIDDLLPEEEDERMAGALHDAPTQTRSASEGNAPSTADQSAILNPQSAIETTPPLGACSPQTPAAPEPLAAHSHPVAVASEPSTPCAESYWQSADFLQGLRLFESRLLTLIANTHPNEPDRLQSLNESLADIRHEIAELEPKLAATSPAISLTLAPDRSPQLQADLHPSSNEPGCGRFPTEPYLPTDNQAPQQESSAHPRSLA